jgi:hypothetical protein
MVAARAISMSDLTVKDKFLPETLLLAAPMRTAEEPAAIFPRRYCPFEQDAQVRRRRGIATLRKRVSANRQTKLASYSSEEIVFLSSFAL